VIGSSLCSVSSEGEFRFCEIRFQTLIACDTVSGIFRLSVKSDTKITFDSTRNMNMKNYVWKTGLCLFQIMIFQLNLELRTVQTPGHMFRTELPYDTKI
jgi:hypothetical protein